MKKIKFSFSTKSIDRAIKELEDYKKSLRAKNQLFVERLSMLGLTVASMKVRQAKGDDDKDVQYEAKFNSSGSIVSAELILNGKDAVFIEFGAGIHYNGSVGTSPHPKGNELGYTIGSYGKGKGANDYWYYTDSNGVGKRSMGTEATMPLYSASLEIIRQVASIAREVFGS